MITPERLAEIEASPREASIFKAEAKELADAYRERVTMREAEAEITRLITAYEQHRAERALKELESRAERYQTALREVEPYLDAIICYASTQGEHHPNKIAANIRAALAEGGRRDD